MNDLLHVRTGDTWKFTSSSYRKLRLNASQVSKLITDVGLVIEHSTTEQGIVRIVARSGRCSDVGGRLQAISARIVTALTAKGGTRPPGALEKIPSPRTPQLTTQAGAQLPKHNSIFRTCLRR